MNRLKVTLFFAMMTGFSMVWAAASPIPMLENSANRIIKTLQENQSSLKSRHDLIQKTVEQNLLPHVDVAGMSRSVLGREAWNRSTPAERARFSSAFTQLVIRTYSNPLAEYSGETVEFKPLRGAPNGHFVRVSSIIKRPGGQQIPLNYSLVLKSGEWKIYDLSVEGVSLLQSFRTQFAEVLHHGSMESLIQAMQHPKKAA